MTEKTRPSLLFLMIGTLTLCFPLGSSQLVESNAGETNLVLGVYNLNTSLAYVTIQEVIDAPETLNGHIINVSQGVYLEHVTINKSLTIRGEDPKTTIIDGEGVGTVIHINADDVSVSGFTINNSGQSSPPLDCGIFLDYSSKCNLSQNVVTNCRYGIYVFHSFGNVLIENNVSDCYEDGIWLYHSGNNSLRGNKASNNRYNFGVFGADFQDFDNVIDISNTVDEKPIHYLIGARNMILNDTPNIGCLYLINSNNITITDLNLTSNGHGLLCWNTTNSKIENITTSENNYGIYLQDSQRNIVDHNFCGDNWVGVNLEDSTWNTANNNTLSNNEKGVSLYKANSNNVTSNIISYNLFGIRLYASSFNNLFHNNLIENNVQVDLINSYQNNWDNCGEGNFWSDYQNIYPNASEIDSSGIWDTPYIIDENNQDRYPLIPELQLSFILIFFILASIPAILTARRSSENRIRPKNHCYIRID